jgi:hypothetical protein
VHLEISHCMQATSMGFQIVFLFFNLLACPYQAIYKCQNDTNILPTITYYVKGVHLKNGCVLVVVVDRENLYI